LHIESSFCNHYPAVGPEIAEVHLVFSCSDRKRHAPDARHRLGAVRQPQLRTRARVWTRLLVDGPGPELPASEMYSGDHASVVRAVARQPGVEVWFASAGYGLVPATAPIRPYSATFGRSHPDAVGGSPEEWRRWWLELAKWPGPAPGQPRSIEALASRRPPPRLIVALGSEYLAALRNDLAGAAASSSASISVISAGGRSVPPGIHVLPASAEMQGAVGGSRISLNSRLVRALVSTAAEHCYQPTEMAAVLQALRLGDGNRIRRQPMTDDEVVLWLRSRPQPRSRSSMLADLRSSGRACERVRFDRLYTEVFA
jgi:hypothetical protein